jgi:predicted O-methyltransferase YrrM
MSAKQIIKNFHARERYDMLQKTMTALKTLNSLFLELIIEGPDKYVYEYVYNLFFLVTQLRPQQILELGTGSKGIGTRAMLAGLIFNGEDGQITTVEIDDSERLHSAHRKLQEKIVLMGGADMVSFRYGNDLTFFRSGSPRFDMIFLDTNHTFDHTLKELQKFSTWTSLIVCHDTKVDSDVPHAVQQAIDKFLETHSEWKNVEVSGTPYGLGILYKQTVKEMANTKFSVGIPFACLHCKASSEAIITVDTETRSVALEVINWQQTIKPA